MTRAIAAIFVLLLVAVGGVYGLQTALEDAGENELVVNESWTPNAGSITVLDESERTGAYYANDTVVYGENDTEMDRGDDYEWFDTNGTVKAVVGGDLDGDSTALITYAYQQTTGEQRQLTAMLSNIPTSVGLIFPAFVFVVAILLLRG